MKNFSLLLLCGLGLISSSCGVGEGAKPIPPEKESFIGVWRSTSGFELEILAVGKANLRQIRYKSDPDWDRLNIKVAPDRLEGLQVRFVGDSTLELIEPLNYGRDYRINRSPYSENGQSKMMLNGVILIRD